jgi:hypothetical protein
MERTRKRRIHPASASASLRTLIPHAVPYELLELPFVVVVPARQRWAVLRDVADGPSYSKLVQVLSSRD